jgi:hypothetical protein
VVSSVIRRSCRDAAGYEVRGDRFDVRKGAPICGGATDLYYLASRLIALAIRKTKVAKIRRKTLDRNLSTPGRLSSKDADRWTIFGNCAPERS